MLELVAPEYLGVGVGGTGVFGVGTFGVFTRFVKT